MVKNRQSKLTYLLIVILALLTLSPVVMLVIGSFSKGLNTFGDFTLAKYISVYTDPSFYAVLGNTLIFVLFSALFSIRWFKLCILLMSKLINIA